VVVAISTALGARNGLLVRDPRGLEEARNVRAVFFDKTGTLTRGEPGVVEITTAGNLTEDDALALAAAVEYVGAHDRAGHVVRPESRDAVQRLHDQGIEVVMVTGDAEPVARAVAADIGIDTVFAEVLPDQKSSKVSEVQQRGKRVAMIGDGVNDAPALVTADVGIAIGAGTGVAVEAGDVVLVRSDPRDVPRIFALSKATYRKMIQNLGGRRATTSLRFRSRPGCWPIGTSCCRWRWERR